MAKIVDGTPVNKTVTNDAFLFRDEDDIKFGKQGFQNADPVSGSPIDNIQRAVNKIYEGLGCAGETDTLINTYSSTNYIANGDNRKVAIGKLDADLLSKQNQINAVNQDINDLETQINAIAGGEGMQTVLGARDEVGVGDGLNTTFALSGPANDDFAVIFLDGLKAAYADYTVVGTGLEFNDPVPEFVDVDAFYFVSAQGDTLDGELLIRINSTTYSYTKDPRTKDGFNLYVNGVFIYKNQYSMNTVTKQITFFSPVELGSIVESVICAGTTAVDSYQLDFGYETNIELPVNAVNNNSLIVMVNGVYLRSGEYTIMNGMLSLLSPLEVGSEVNVISYVASKGFNDFTIYKTILAAENTARSFQLAIQPRWPSKVLLDVRSATFLIYDVDFSIDQDILTLLNTTNGNAVVTNSILRLFYKG